MEVAVLGRRCVKYSVKGDEGVIDTYTKTRWEIEDLNEEELTPAEYVFSVISILAENGLMGNYYWSCKSTFGGGLG